MGVDLIMSGNATLEDLYELNSKKGVEFVVEDGCVTEVIF